MSGDDMIDDMDDNPKTDGLVQSTPTDPMDQVRDLLFGQAQKTTDTRIEDIYARLDELNDTFQLRIDVLESKLDDIAVKLSDDRIECMQHIGDSLTSLGKEISKSLTIQNLKNDR